MKARQTLNTGLLRSLLLAAALVAIAVGRAAPGEILNLGMSSTDSIGAVYVNDSLISGATPRGFTQSSVESITSALIDPLQRQGHYFARVTVDSVVLDRPEVSLYLSLVPGPIVRAREVRLEGLIRSNPNAILRRLPPVKGQPVTSQLLHAVSQSAEQLDHVVYQEPVMLQVLPGFTETDVLLRLKERQPISIFGGGGYAPDDPVGLVWNLRLALRNLLGGGRQVDLLSARPDRGRTILDVKYRQPVFWLHRDNLRLSVATRDYRESFYEFAASAGLESRFTATASLSADLRWRRVEPNDDRPGFSSYAIEFGFDRTQLDSQRNPSRGTSLTSTLTFQHRRYSNDSLAMVPQKAAINETRTDISAGAYLPAMGPLVAHLAAGYNGLESNDPDIPLSELVLAGGKTGLRGYRTEQFAAQRVAFLLAEPRLRFQSGYLHVFFESAYLNLSDNAADSDGEFFRFGGGFGFALIGDRRTLTVSLAWGKDALIDLPRLNIELSADI